MRTGHTAIYCVFDRVKITVNFFAESKFFYLRYTNMNLFEIEVVRMRMLGVEFRINCSYWIYLNFPDIFGISC